LRWGNTGITGSELILFGRARRAQQAKQRAILRASREGRSITGQLSA
jgi:hypothetical protein